MTSDRIARFLCWFGFHRWERQPDEDVQFWMALEPARIRKCRRCDLTQAWLKRPFNMLPDKWIRTEPCPHPCKPASLNWNATYER